MQEVDRVKFRCDRDALSEALQTVQRGVSSRPGIPALTGVLIDGTDDGRLTLTTTDLEVSARLATDAQVSEAGTALVPARLLGDSVKSLSDAPVDVETDQSQAHFRCAAYEGTLRLLPAVVFPGIQEPGGTRFTAEAGAFAEAVHLVARGASRDEARPVLTGVLIEVSREGVVMVATDSYRLAVRDLVATSDGEGKAIVPERALSEAGRAAATDDGRLTLTTTDLEVSARLATDAQVSEAGTAVVPARLLGDTVKSLSDAPVDVETDPSLVHIRCAAYEGTLRLLPAEDFPGLQEPGGTRITAEAGAFAEAVHQVARGASRDEARPVLTGVLIEVSREGVVMVATDSYRLAVRDLVATADGEGQAIVPERALSEAGRAAATDEKASIEIFVDESQVAFRVGELTLTSRLIEGEFPNYRQLLPDQHESRLTISRQQLLDAVSRVGLLARDTTPVRLEFNALGVKLSSSSPDLGQAVETVEARYEGDDLTVAFNPQYLADGLRAANGESVRIDVRDGLKPGVVRGESDEFTYLVMPVRLPAAVS
jgi:DNA polymerase-3 subunit beta